MTTAIDPHPEFSWQAHPARERVVPAVLGAVLLVSIAGLAGVFMQSPVWALFALLVLGVALNRFFLPSRFSIDAEGITARYPLRRQRFRWADLRRVVHDERGAYLSTRSRRSWLDAYRGLHVLFGAEREAVLDRLRDHLPRGGGSWAA